MLQSSCESFIYFLSPTNFCTSYSRFLKREDHLAVVFSFSGIELKQYTKWITKLQVYSTLLI